MGFIRSKMICLCINRKGCKTIVKLHDKILEKWLSSSIWNQSFCKTVIVKGKQRGVFIQISVFGENSCSNM